MKDDLQNYMYMTSRFGDRVAMWHEAGHAVVAMHYGVKVWCYGLDPLPHALVNSLGLTKHQKGVLLCAGAAMTKAVYGQEWGGDCTDWKMAEAYGDLEAFKAEAEALVQQLLPQAKYLVQARLGLDVRPHYADPQWWGEDVEEHLPELTVDHPHFSECVKAAEKGVMPKWLRGATMAFARFQMKHTAFVAKYLGV